MAQCPEKLQTAYDDREQKTTETQKWKKSVPHIKNVNILLLKTHTEYSTQLPELYARNTWPLVMNILDAILDEKSTISKV